MIQIGPHGAKPLIPRVIVTADIDQKKEHIVENSDIKIHIETQYNNNYRERNPNYATVVYVSDSDKFIGWNMDSEFDNILEPGDKICLQHFQLVNDRLESQQVAESQNGDPLFFIDIKEVYFKIVNDQPVLLSNFTLCEYSDIKTDITNGGIIIPEMAKDKIIRDSKRAIVRYVSDFASKTVSPGDEVLFIDYADYELEFNGKKYLKIASDEILCKIIDNNLIPVA